MHGQRSMPPPGCHSTRMFCVWRPCVAPRTCGALVAAALMTSSGGAKYFSWQIVVVIVVDCGVASMRWRHHELTAKSVVCVSKEWSVCGVAGFCSSRIGSSPIRVVLPVQTAPGLQTSRVLVRRFDSTRWVSNSSI